MEEYISLKNRTTDLNANPDNEAVVYVKNGTLFVKSSAGINASIMGVSENEATPNPVLPYAVFQADEFGLPIGATSLETEEVVNTTGVEATYVEEAFTSYTFPSGFYLVNASVVVDNDNVDTLAGNVRTLSLEVDEVSVISVTQTPAVTTQQLDLSYFVYLTAVAEITLTVTHDADAALETGLVTLNIVKVG